MSETRVQREAPGLDRGLIADFAERWQAAWNSHQPDRLLDLTGPRHL